MTHECRRHGKPEAKARQKLSDIGSLDLFDFVLHARVFKLKI